MSDGGPSAKKLAADAPEVAARVRSELTLARICALKIKKQLGGSILDVDELEAMGREGLLDAARTYAPDRGVQFRAWAYLKIRGAILDGVRSQSPLPKAAYQTLRAFQRANETREGQIEDESAATTESADAADQRVASTTAALAMAMAASFLNPKTDAMEQVKDSVASPEDQVIRSTLLEKVRGAIAALPDAERALMNAIYFEDATLEEAGKKLGLSKSWSCRLHARAVEAVSLQVREATRETAVSEE